MTRYLVTGATTPLGQSVIRSLLSESETERIVAVGAERIRSVTVEIDGRVRYVRTDLSRERNLRELLFGVGAEEGVEVVVDMASHRRLHATGRAARALNVLATRRLLRFAEEHRTIGRFVYRSYGEIYDASDALPSLIDEAHPLDLRPFAPQWIRDRIEADLNVCARTGISSLTIAVLRFAECLAPNTGSQLHDYLRSSVCFRPLGYNPIFNLISETDFGRAMALAVRSDAQGIFTIPGATTLPLSEIIRRSGRRQVAVPGPVMTPLYLARRALFRTDFDYGLNRGRLHFGGILDGTRAREVLGYLPQVPVTFPED